MNLKKIISIFICGIMLLAYVTVPAEESSAYNGYEKIYEKMNKLGLLSTELDYSDENAIVKRVDFIIAALKLIGKDSNPSVSEALFSDVDKDYYAAGYIQTGVSLGFLSGYTDGSFMPENPIAMNQAVKIIVRLLGYSRIAEASGGYPNGYLSAAYDKNLLKGIENTNEALTYGDMLKLFENAVETDIMSLVFEGENIIFEEKEDNTLLSAYHDIYYEEGIVNATEITSLMGYAETAEGKVNIAGREYFTGNSSISSKLGFGVDFYYRENEDDTNGTILYFEEDDKNYTVTVNYEDIIKTNSAYTFSYYDERDRKQTEDITADTNIIVNGKAKPFYSAEDLVPQYGEVTLIDNNNDDKFEVIDIFNVTDTVVVSRNAYSDGKYNITDKVSASKVFSINEEDKYVIYKNGSQIGITDIIEDDVLTIGEGDGYIKIIVSNNAVEGTVSGIAEGNKAVINGEEYVITKTYLDLSESLVSVQKIKIGISGKFYLDCFGSIAAAPAASTDSVRYGFLFKIYEDEEEENKIKLKLLNDEGNTVIYETTEKIKLNGKNVEGNVVKEALEAANEKDGGRKEGTLRQLISFTLNDSGLIKTINTAGATDDFRYEGSFVSDYYYDFYLGTWGREFWEDSDTKVFCIYEDDTQCEVVSEYKSVLTEQNKDYEMYFYNRDSSLQVDVALRYFEGEATSKSAAINMDKLMVMAEKVTYGLDADENAVKMIEGIDVKGNKHEVYVGEKTNSYVEGLFNAIVPGDVFIYQTNNVGDLIGIIKIFDVTKSDIYGSIGQDSTAKGNSVHGFNEYTVIHSNRSAVYGKVLYAEDKNIVYEVESGKELMIRLSSAPIAIMDISANGKVSITTGASETDILPGSNILFSTTYNAVKGAIVIKTE